MVSVSGKVSRSANQRAIAASYAAVAANARRRACGASRARSRRHRGSPRARGRSPRAGRRARQWAKFFAARAQQRRTADVDELDGLLLGDPVTRHRGLERVEVHAHEIERLDRLLLERAHVLLDVQPRQDARVHPRVERLHASAEHLRERRQALDADHLQADVLEQAGGAAARHDLDVERGQAARECREPGLVVGRDQRPHATPCLPGRARRTAAEASARRTGCAAAPCRSCRSRRWRREPGR